MDELQCLPISKPPGAGGNKGQLWTASDQGIQLWTNPTFYWLVSISAQQSAGSHVATQKNKVVRSTADLMKKIATLNGMVFPNIAMERRAAQLAKQISWQERQKGKQVEREKQNVATKKSMKLHRRSGKRKNWRPPPQQKEIFKPQEGVLSQVEKGGAQRVAMHPSKVRSRKRRGVISDTKEGDTSTASKSMTDEGSEALKWSQTDNMGAEEQQGDEGEVGQYEDEEDYYEDEKDESSESYQEDAEGVSEAELSEWSN